MTSRINNPDFLKLYLPLNSHTEDISEHGNDGVGSNLTYVDGPFGRTIGDFNGSANVTYSTISAPISYSWWENPSTFRFYDGTNYYTNGVLGSSFTLRVTSTQIGVSYTGQIWNTRIYNIALTQEEILEIYNLERRTLIPVAIQQPLNLLPDVTENSLVGSWLNSATRNIAKDYSNAGNDGIISGGLAFENVGAKFNSGNLTWSSLSVVTQRYSIKESDGWNRYTKNSIDSYKNGVAGATLPVDMTSTGFVSGNYILKDIEIYNEDKIDFKADYERRVPDPSLLLHLMGGDRDLSRFNRTLTNTSTVVGGRDMVLSSSNLLWSTVTAFTTQVFWHRATGAKWIHWASDGTLKYKNGVLTSESLPITIAVTGLPTGTYKVSNLKLYNEIKLPAFIQQSYLRERQYY